MENIKNTENVEQSEKLTNNNETVDSSIEKINKLISNIGIIIRGKEQELRKVVTTLIAGGHILVEDNPGSGKTAMAKSLAVSIAGNANKEQTNDNEKQVDFKRIQFTPDLLPMDLLGIHVFDDNTKDFVFKKGPLFANIILADEINRASPKVQSALLECMAENQITIGEITYPLDDFFFVIATQNPVEMEGTYPLPAAQLDRFFMKITFGYVSDAVEIDIYNNYLLINRISESIQAVIAYNDIIKLRKEAEDIELHPEIINSVKNIIFATRSHHQITLGASTRSGIIFLRSLRAYALINNRNYVIEDDIKDLASSILNHRLIFKNKQSELTALGEIVNSEIDRLSKLKIKF